MKKMILSIAATASIFSATARIKIFTVCYPSIKASGCWNFSATPDCTNCLTGKFRENGTMIQYAKAGISVPDGAEAWEVEISQMFPGAVEYFEKLVLAGNSFEDGNARVFPRQRAVWSTEANAFLLYCYVSNQSAQQ